MCLLVWEQATHSLPLAWHKLNCCLALRVSEGEDGSCHSLCPALASPRWPVVWRIVRNRKPQGEVYCTRLKSLPAAQKLSSAAEGTVSKMSGLEVVKLGATLEFNHRNLLLQQCSAPASLCKTPEPHRATGKRKPPAGERAQRSAGWAQHQLQEKVAQATFPDPSLFLARVRYQEVIFPFSTIFSKQVSLLY